MKHAKPRGCGVRLFNGVIVATVILALGVFTASIWSGVVEQGKVVMAQGTDPLPIPAITAPPAAQELAACYTSNQPSGQPVEITAYSEGQVVMADRRHLLTVEG